MRYLAQDPFGDICQGWSRDHQVNSTQLTFVSNWVDLKNGPKTDPCIINVPVTIEKWHRMEGDNVRIKTIMRIRYTCAHIILTIHVQIFSTLHIITEISSNMKVRFTLCFWK